MVGASDDILMIGSYRTGRDWDNIQEEQISEEVRRAAAERIMMLPIPARDPVTGEPIGEWIDAPSSVDAASTTSRWPGIRSRRLRPRTARFNLPIERDLRNGRDRRSPTY